ncbi:MAG: hypothetical protein JNM57_00635 [Cyclobacteriaceae bacterium]|nr:hypothetical protein [Cyclobacteriaceae bacterium]
MKLKIVLIAFGLLPLIGVAQEHTEKISREFTFENMSTTNTLMIANINGKIKVEGYDGERIILELTRTIKAKTETRLEKGKKEIQLGIIDRADSIILFVHGPCNDFGRVRNKVGDNAATWGYNGNNASKHCEQGYDYTTDFVVKVPRSVHLNLSTINEGNVVAERTTGIVHADNINGSISLKNLTQESTASTINGDIDIEYDRNPEKDCRFYSLNGNINAWFQKGLAVNLSFESFNGGFFTNLDKIESLPVKVEKFSGGEGIKFKVAGNRYKVGSGGPLLDFETFNGNVYLKERSN